MMARLEILSGIERRRRWSSGQKLEIVRASLEPGAVIADVARRFDVTRQQIYQWRSAFRAGALTPSMPAFVEVELPSMPGNMDREGSGDAERVEIRLHGSRTLVVPMGIERRQLQGLIRTVEGS